MQEKEQKNIGKNDIFIPETVNERIKHIRKRVNYSQADFAKTIGIKQSTLSDIERGKIGVSTNLIQKISKYYYVSTDWILTGKLSSVYMPDDGSLINIEKLRKMYHMDKPERNIVNSDKAKKYDKPIEIVIDLDRELNMIIYDKLKSIEVQIWPLIDNISGILSPNKIGDNHLFLDEKDHIIQLYSLNYPAPERRYQNIPNDEKLVLIKDLNYSISLFLDEASRLIKMLKNERSL